MDVKSILAVKSINFQSRKARKPCGIGIFQGWGMPRRIFYLFIFFYKKKPFILQIFNEIQHNFMVTLVFTHLVKQGILHIVCQSIDPH